MLVSIDPNTGGVRWADDLGKAIGAGSDTSGGWDARTVGGYLVGYVGQPDAKNPGAAFGVDRSTGALRWLRPNLQTCPVPTADVALLCGADGGIRRVDPATGKDLWNIADWSVPDAPGPWMGVSGDGKLIVGTNHVGAAVTVSVEAGAIGSPAAGQAAWVVVVSEVSSRSPQAAAAVKYVALTDPVPWDLMAAKAASVVGLRAAAVPTVIGQTADGHRVFIDGDGNVESLPA